MPRPRARRLVGVTAARDPIDPWRRQGGEVRVGGGAESRARGGHYGRSEKNARSSGCPNVGTTRDRSRYRLNRSQAGSATKRQP